MRKTSFGQHSRLPAQSDRRRAPGGNLGDTCRVDVNTSLRSSPRPSEVIRRTVAVFLGVASLTAVTLEPGARNCIDRQFARWTETEFLTTDACGSTTFDRSAGFLALMGAFGLLALVLWSAPWQRWTARWARTRPPMTSFRLRRRRRRAAGVVLIALGLAVAFSSIAGMYSNSPQCAWYELWCRMPGNDGFFQIQNLIGLPNNAIRPLDGLERVVGVGLGVAAIWWGVIEIRPTHVRGRRVSATGIGRLGLIGVFVAVAPSAAGLGWPGFGLLQFLCLITGLLFVATALATTAHGQGPRVMNDNHLLAAMAFTFALGAWVMVQRWPALVSPVPFAAAGWYLSYARWQARKQQTAELLEEEQFVAWARASVAE